MLLSFAIFLYLCGDFTPFRHSRLILRDDMSESGWDYLFAVFTAAA